MMLVRQTTANDEFSRLPLGAGRADALAAEPREGAFVFWLTVAFFAVCAFTTLHHQMWRDELQAWMLARDSASLPALFRELKYEGHPGLWYVLLFFLTRFTHAPEAMQALHVGIATAGACVVARFSPFTKLQRGLLVFGYFSLFEYGAISRNYGLGMLLTFVLCAVWRRQWRRPIVPALVLVAMAHTNIYTFILALAFCVSATMRFVFDRQFRQTLLTMPMQAIGAVALVLVGMGLSALQLRPPPDSAFVVGWHFWPGPESLYEGASASRFAVAKVAAQKLAAAIGTIWKAYVPIPKPQMEFWNTNILQGRWSFFQPLPAVLLIAWVVALLRRRPWALVFFGVGVTALVTFTYAKYFGYLRHQGAQFVLLIAALWLAGDAARDNVSEEPALAAPAQPGRILEYAARGKNAPESSIRLMLVSGVFTALLAIHAIVALLACGIDWFVPFSASRQTARYLQQQHLAVHPIVGHWDYTASALSGLLDRPVYLADSRRLGTFIRWTNSRFAVTTEVTMDFARKLARERHEPVIVLLTPDPSESTFLPPSPRPGLRELAHFDRSIVIDERFWVYEIDP